MTRTTNRSALRLLAVVAVALLTVTGAFAPVAAAQNSQPSPPHTYYGSVTDGNGNAVADATVEVRYNGAVINSTTTDSNGEYDVAVTRQDGLSQGDSVTIVVRDEQKERNWEPAGTTQVNFQVSTTTTTTTTTTPGGGGDTTTTTTSGGGGGTGGGGQAGGGGGGGGADEPTTTSTPPTTGASGNAQLDANGSATVDLPDGVGVERVSVSSPGASGDVTVTELSAPPEGVSEPPGSRVAMVDISAPNPSEGSATVQISVRQSALPDGVSASNLEITHYTDGAWQDRDTSVVSSDGPVVLETQVSSFSPFAVTAQDQATATATQTATETATETTGPTDTETSAPTDDGDGGGGGGFPVVPVVIAVVLIAALGGGWLYTQRE